jgi:hypothetical protein
MKPFEIFRTGTHTTAKGQTLTFAETDVADIVASYDPALHHAPIVVGHPKQDGPAYGWVKSLSVQGDRIVASAEKVDVAFSEMVRDGRFGKVSAGLYHPSQAGNPTPGRYHLRHVGFLGAEPPAVKGLKAIEFAEAEVDIEISFSEAEASWAFGTIARVLRAIRDRFIETDGTEKANQVVSDWELETITQAAADMRANAPGLVAHFSETTPKDETMETVEQRQAALDARETALKERETTLSSNETTFSESRRKVRADEDAAFVASVVQAGRLPVGLQHEVTALFSELDDATTLTFSEGDQSVTKSPRDALRSLLDKLPVPVTTRELATGDGPDFSDPAHVQEAIITEIKAAKDRGETLDPASALSRIKSRK